MEQPTVIKKETDQMIDQELIPAIHIKSTECMYSQQAIKCELEEDFIDDSLKVHIEQTSLASLQGNPSHCPVTVEGKTESFDIKSSPSTSNFNTLKFVISKNDSSTNTNNFETLKMILSKKSLPANLSNFEMSTTNTCVNEVSSENNIFTPACTSHSEEASPHINQPVNFMECKFCFLTFTTSRSLSGHMKSLHKDCVLMCHQCEKTFSRKSNLKKHIDAVHKQVKHTCDECGMQLTSKHSLKVHVESVHKLLKHTCSLCGLQVTTKGYLTAHINNVHKRRKHECDLCGAQFSQRSGLYYHVESFHKQVKYSCHECGLQFKHQTTLRKHKHTAHSQKHEQSERMESDDSN